MDRIFFLVSARAFEMTQARASSEVSRVRVFESAGRSLHSAKLGHLGEIAAPSALALRFIVVFYYPFCRRAGCHRCAFVCFTLLIVEVHPSQNLGYIHNRAACDFRRESHLF